MGFCSFRIDAPNWASVVHILFVFHSDFCLALVTVESSKQKRTENRREDERIMRKSKQMEGSAHNNNNSARRQHQKPLNAGLT